MQNLAKRATAVTVGLAVAMTTAAAAAGPRTVDVRVKDIEFAPKRVTIKRGDTVRWLFLDARTPHNVRSTGRPRFKGSPTKQEGSYRVRFTRRGTYRYVCSIHLNMKGTVVVR